MNCTKELHLLIYFHKKRCLPFGLAEHTHCCYYLLADNSSIILTVFLTGDVIVDSIIAYTFIPRSIELDRWCCILVVDISFILTWKRIILNINPSEWIPYDFAGWLQAACGPFLPLDLSFTFCTYFCSKDDKKNHSPNHLLNIWMERISWWFLWRKSNVLHQERTLQSEMICSKIKKVGEIEGAKVMYTLCSCIHHLALFS